MRRLRAGLIGAGAFGRKHLEAMKAIPDLEIRAVADVNTGTAVRAAREYGAKGVYQDYRQMIAREKLDFVDVCTPEPMHREPVVEAAEHGVNVLVEKPIATTMEDADAMIRAAEKNHVSMLVGHLLRWDPRYASVKEMIDRDELGRIASIYARRTTPRSVASTYLTRVGVLPVLGIHDVDLILWYTGRKVRECSAYATRLLRYANPDSVVCALSFQGGTTAALMFSFAVPDNKHYNLGTRMEIIAAKSFVVIDTGEQGVQVTRKNSQGNPDLVFSYSMRGETIGCLRDEIEYFADRVRNGTKVALATPQEAREALRVALACQRSAADGRPVAM